MVPPFCVNFVALLSRFSRIWFRQSLLQRIIEIPLCYEICKEIAYKTKKYKTTYISLYLIQTKFTSVCVKEK